MPQQKTVLNAASDLDKAAKQFIITMQHSRDNSINIFAMNYLRVFLVFSAIFLCVSCRGSRSILAIDDETYDIMIKVMLGMFKVPVKERTLKHKICHDCICKNNDKCNNADKCNKLLTANVITPTNVINFDYICNNDKCNNAQLQM